MRRWLPVILWACLIFSFSTNSFSGANTGRYIVRTLHVLLPSASEHAIDLLHELIRKGAHVFEYFVFGLLLFRAFRASQRGWSARWAINTLVVAGLFAASDEFHQAFVPSRSSSPLDAMLDTSAAALAVFVVWLIAHRYSATSRPSMIPPTP